MSTRILCNCIICDKEIEKYQRDIDRNTLHYCSRECYNNRNKGKLKKIKRHTKYYDNLLSHSICTCGVSSFYLLQIHHIDGNNKNNIPENLEVVCSNCHIKRHLKKRNKDGKLVYSPKTLTDRNLLKDL